MIELTISDKNPNSWILHELEHLNLAFIVTESSETDHPILKSGNEVYEGNEQIKEYLPTLKKLLDDWYACRCDMFEPVD